MSWEFSILDAIQNLHTPLLDSFFTTVTWFGRDFWIMLGIFLLFFRRTRVCGICMLSGLLVGALITNVTIKPLVARDRPCWINDTVQLLVSNPRDYSFPSGHSQASFVSAMAIYQNHRKWGIAAFVFAAFIAFSRLYLYVHFPTDVAVGILIGLVVGYFTSRFVKTWIQKRPAVQDISCEKQARCFIL